MAARKYILAPEEQYRALLENEKSNGKKKNKEDDKDDERENEMIEEISPLENKKDLGDEDYLKYAREKLEATLQKKPKNAYELAMKNLRYQDELRRYLRLRNKIRNRPTKVEIANLGGLMFKGDEGDDKGEVGRIDENVNELVPFGLESLPKEKLIEMLMQAVRGQKKAVTESSSRYPSSSTNPNGEVSDYQEVEETPFGGPSRREILDLRTQARQQELQERVDALKKQLMSDPKKYGVTSEGRILNKAEAQISDSDLMSSIRRLVDPKSSIFSPPGTSTLRSRLLKDPVTKDLITGIPLSFEDQSGHGKIGAFKRISTKKRNSFYFKPKLWIK